MRKEFFSKILGINCIRIDEYADERGFFFESFKLSNYANSSIFGPIQQINFSSSRFGALRGLHLLKTDRVGSKFVTCIVGEVQDVVVDLRRNSPTYGKYEFFNLSSTARIVIQVPAGFAHGFLSLREDSIVSYAQDFEYNPELEICINPFDGDLGISWPRDIDFIQSKKDKNGVSIRSI